MIYICIYAGSSKPLSEFLYKIFNKPKEKKEYEKLILYHYYVNKR